MHLTPHYVLVTQLLWHSLYVRLSIGGAKGPNTLSVTNSFRYI